MKKYHSLIFLTLLFSLNICFAQNIKFSNLKQSLSLDNEVTKDRLLLLSGKDKQLGIYLNKENQILDSIQIPFVAKKYKSILAYTFDKNNMNLFWTDNRKDSVFVQQLSFNNKNITTKSIALQYSRRLRKVTEFQHNNKYYFVSIKDQTNELTFHIFNSDGEIEEKTISLNDLSFLDYENKTVNFYNLISTKFSYEDTGIIFQQIISDEYTALSLAISERKAYIKQNQLILSIDQNPDHLYLVHIDLNSLQYNLSDITTPAISKIDQTICNTFLLDDYIYISKLNSDNFHFLIKDFNNNLIKEWEVKKENNITFKTTPIIQLNGELANYRELETTNQFIRKSINLKSAITAYNYNNSILVTFGAVSNEKPKTTFGLYFGLIGAIVDISMLSPSLHNLDAYANRKVVYFNSLLTQDFKVEQKNINPLALEQIKNFIKEQKSENTNYTLSNFKEKYFLGYYNKKLNIYTFKTFED